MRSLFLASASPRRQELLEKAGVTFQTYPVKVSEFPQENLNVDEQILAIAEQKARAAGAELRTKIQGPFAVLSADTEVIIQGRLAGKPLDEADAFRKLKWLSQKTHEVKTAVCLVLYPENKILSHLETTQVSFHDLKDEEIWNYIKTGEPMDKAGAYGIQGKARVFVKEFNGSFENVVGLPIDVVLKMLTQSGVT